MKRCPKCGQTYADKDLNFCYNDGELLSYFDEGAPPAEFAERPLYSNDPPPTEFLPSPRVTHESRRPPPFAPPAVWQANQPEAVNVPFSQYPTYFAPNQTLAIVSLGLGLGSVTVGWCCSSGFVLSPAAIVTGIIALSLMKKDPSLYGGKGFAIGGIISAAVFLVIYLVFIIIYIIALLLGSAV